MSSLINNTEFLVQIQIFLLYNYTYIYQSVKVVPKKQFEPQHTNLVSVNDLLKA